MRLVNCSHRFASKLSEFAKAGTDASLGSASSRQERLQLSKGECLVVIKLRYGDILSLNSMAQRDCIVHLDSPGSRLVDC